MHWINYIDYAFQTTTCLEKFLNIFSKVNITGFSPGGQSHALSRPMALHLPLSPLPSPTSAAILW